MDTYKKIMDFIPTYCTKHKTVDKINKHLLELKCSDSFDQQLILKNITYFVLNQINNKFPINEEKLKHELLLGRSFDLSEISELVISCKKIMKDDKFIDNFCNCIILDKCYITCISVIEEEPVQNLINEKIWSKLINIFGQFSKTEYFEFKSVLYKLMFVNQLSSKHDIRKCYRGVLNDSNEIGNIIRQMVQQIIYFRSECNNSPVEIINYDVDSYYKYNQIFTFNKVNVTISDSESEDSESEDSESVPENDLILENEN